MSSFGEMVRDARGARGWTQRDLAQRVGVSQRAVSAWELAVSEPDDAVKRRVAAQLGLPPDPVSTATAPRHALDKRNAGRARLAELPLDVLDPQEFEDFAVSLLRELYPGAGRPYRLGRSGHKQFGFDVVAEQDGKVRVAVQCKRVERFGPSEVHRAVAAAVMPADEAYVFLSKVASPAAHAAMRQHAGWQLWDRQRLSHAVHDLAPGAAARIVDRYFPNLRYDFLGLPRPGPWLDPEEYFRRIARSEHYSHRWRLVGREEVLEDLAVFAAGDGGRVAVLAGRGGTGKTKMLHALCERLSVDQGLSVVFLDRDPDVDAGSFELLPAGRLLVVIDDAHDEAIPVAKVTRGVYAANPGASVLLALRPYGEPGVRLELRNAGVPAAEVFRCELDDLEAADAEALAREVLGEDAMRFAARLAHAARDCPLLLVASADLIRRGRLSPERLEGDADMSRELTEVLAGAVIDDMARYSEVRVEVLHAVAALQPLRTAEAEFREALAALTGRAYDQAAPHIAALEEMGLLLRRGETFRVVPDLLGDWLLARRSHGPGGSASTGYIDRVHQVVSGTALANLIVNAGRMDWQKRSSATGLLDGLWKSVRAEFEAGDSDARLEVLAVLAKVAFFQPRPCLDIVRWALDHPPGDAESGAELVSQCNEEGMRDAVCQVLHGAAYDPEYFAEAADLLWQLGRDDARQPGQHPHHAMRILGELAGFRPAGPTTYQHLLVDAVRRWLSRPAADGSRDPLEVLQPMLAPQGHQELWNPRAVSWRPFVLDPRAEAVTNLRTKVLDLTFEQISASDPWRVLAAFDVIGAALTPPMEGFGLDITAEIRDLWYPEFTRILGRLERALRHRPALQPVLCVALRSRLQWLAEHGTAQVRKACLKVISTLPSGMPYDLARALHGGPVDPPHDPHTVLDLQYRQAALSDLFTTVISSMESLPDADVIDETERCLSELGQLLDDDASCARPFLYKLVTVQPSLAAAIASSAASDTSGMLAGHLPIVLIALAGTADPAAVTIARRLLTVQDTAVARHVAHAFGLQRGRVGQLLPGEDDLLRALVVHHDPVVHAMALAAVRTLGPRHRDLAVELLLSVPPERSGFAWWEVAFAAGPTGEICGTLAWTDLPAEYKDRFFTVLRDTSSIEIYEASELLAMLSRDEPSRVLSLLTSRIERVENGAPAEYLPLPGHWQGKMRFREHDSFLDILRAVCEWLAAAPGSMWRRYYGSDLFSLVAGTFDEAARQVIGTFLQEPDPARVTAAASILHGIPQSEIWNLGFVRQCLRAASQCGPASLDAVQGALYHAVVSGRQWDTFGQPTLKDLDQDTPAQLADQCASGSPEKQFYRALAASAQEWGRRRTAIAGLPDDGRQW